VNLFWLQWGKLSVFGALAYFILRYFYIILEQRREAGKNFSQAGA